MDPRMFPGSMPHLVSVQTAWESDNASKRAEIEHLKARLVEARKQHLEPLEREIKGRIDRARRELAKRESDGPPEDKGDNDQAHACLCASARAMIVYHQQQRLVCAKRHDRDGAERHLEGEAEARRELARLEGLEP